MGFPPVPSGPSPPAVPTQTVHPAQPASTAFKPNYDILASMNTSRPVSQSSTPVPGSSPQARSTATPPQTADPFASLVSASPRPVGNAYHPPAPQSQSTPASSSLLDLAGGNTSPPQPARQPAAEDDEWNFASSLPPSNALPAANQVQVLNSQLRVDFQARRMQNAPRQIYIKAVFSNNTSQPIGDLHFQVAVEKVSVSTTIHCTSQTKRNCLTSHTRCSFDRSPVEKSPRNNSMVYSRRCWSMALTRARETR